MKSRIVEKAEVRPEFKTGDFFMTPSRNIRQIVTNLQGFVSSLDSSDGRMYYEKTSIESLVSEYEYEGLVKRVVPAGFDNDTKEVLFMEV